MIINMYITTMSVIIGGILNMIFTKTNFYKNHNSPIDNSIVLKDGKRLFGDNKTWIGFFFMIFICGIVQVLWGMLCDFFNITSRNEFYLYHNNTISYNLLCGLLLGFAYMICELPNSFIKRRLNIAAGKTNRGFIGKLFFIIDQLDSMFGVMLILVFFSNISISRYALYVLLGGITHICVNLVLYKIKVRRNL